jgi:hypothetical protein
MLEHVKRNSAAQLIIANLELEFQSEEKQNEPQS